MTWMGTVMVPRSFTAGARHRALVASKRSEDRRYAAANPYLVRLAIAGGFLPRVVYGVVADAAIMTTISFAVCTPGRSFQTMKITVNGSVLMIV